MNFSLIPPCVPEKKSLELTDRQTDEQQSEPIMVSFFRLRYGTLKTTNSCSILFDRVVAYLYGTDNYLFAIAERFQLGCLEFYELYS